MQAPLCLKIGELYRMDHYIGQTQNKISWLIVSVSILDKEV